MASARTQSAVVLPRSALSITSARASSRRPTVSIVRTAWAQSSAPSALWPAPAARIMRTGPRAAARAAGGSSDGAWSTCTTTAAWPAKCASRLARTAAATAATVALGPAVARPTTRSAVPIRSTVVRTSSASSRVSITG